MKRVFAILHEPASYTVDRNVQVYDKLGVRYCYMNSDSLAKSSVTKTVGSFSELSNWALIKSLYRILKENDIIIMNGYTGKVFRLLFLINLFYRKNIGLDSDTQLNIPSNPLKRMLKYVYLSSVFKNKHYWGLPGGTKSHTDLFRYYGMSDNRICLMPMVVDNERFRMDGSRDNSRFCFLYVGRVIDVKNVSMMIEAFKNVSEYRQNLELRIVGTGNLLNELKSRYKDCVNIHFIGPKYGDELAEEYKNASAFILPSLYEPWGLVVNEAMASGLPVIVSDKVGAAGDLVDGYDTGFIFNVDDMEDLKAKMQKLVDDTGLYESMSKNAFDRLNNQWNYAFYTECLENFINKASAEL